MRDATKGTSGTKRPRFISFPVLVVVAGAIVSVAVAALLLYVMPGSGETAQESRLYRATKAYEKGDLVVAESELQDIVEGDPTDLEARATFGLTLRDLGKIDEAVEQYRVIVKAEPSDDAALYQLALLERLAGDSESAMKHLAAAIDVDEQAAYCDELARTAIQLGRYEEAIAAWRRALKDQSLEPSRKAELLAALSQAYQDSKMYTEAKQALVDALALTPDNADLKVRLEALEG